MSDELYKEYGTSIYNKANVAGPAQFKRSAEYFSKIYAACLPADKQARILDIGCGGGDFLSFLEKQGYVNCQGIDLSPEQAAACGQRVACPVTQADAGSFLDGKESSYDFIAAHDVLEHVPKAEVVILVKKIFAALKEGGVFAARVPNMSNPFAAHGRYIDLTHELGFTERSLEQLLFVGGFRRIECVGGLMVLRRGIRPLLRRIFLKGYYAWVRFLYYVQDYSVPRILDHNITAICRKTKEGA
jgi:cyclopropane fatty-acyl-phospholipid synthase-like methyltransferase